MGKGRGREGGEWKIGDLEGALENRRRWTMEDVIIVFRSLDMTFLVDAPPYCMCLLFEDSLLPFGLTLAIISLRAVCVFVCGLNPTLFLLLCGRNQSITKFVPFFSSLSTRACVYTFHLRCHYSRIDQFEIYIYIKKVHERGNTEGRRGKKKVACVVVVVAGS